MRKHFSKALLLYCTHFTPSLRGTVEPELSKKLYKVIKAEGSAITSYESAGRDRAAIASQLSEWGEETGDDAISEISDKLGVLMSEIGEQEDAFAINLEEARSVLKTIRNTERSVQPSRDHKVKISDEIQKLKYVQPIEGLIIATRGASSNRRTHHNSSTNSVSFVGSRSPRVPRS